MNVKLIVLSGILVLATCAPALAKGGTISATKTGTISATRTGTISATTAGTVSSNRSGTISGTRSGISSTTQTVVVDRAWLLELLLFAYARW